MKDWKIVGRRFYDSTWEQNEYGLCEFLHYLDKAQPEDQQLGGDMIDCLIHHGKTISDVYWNYSYEINKRKEEGLGCTGFKIGSYYSLNERQPDKILRVVDKPFMEIIVEMNGEELTLPRFQWKDWKGVDTGPRRYEREHPLGFHQGGDRMSLFETGPIVMTEGIREMMVTGYQDEIQSCLDRHMSGDWGDLNEEDRQMNDDALEAEKKGDWTDSLFSAYKTGFGKIYIITECDRSVTTILLPEEY